MTSRSKISSVCFLLEMDERGQQWREKREEDRTRNEFLEGRRIMKNTMNTIEKLTKENISFINNDFFLFTYIHPFYRVKCLKKERHRSEGLHCRERRCCYGRL